jgi:hypothetical protein
MEKRERELTQKIESAIQETPKKERKRVEDVARSDDEEEEKEGVEAPKELSKRALKRQRQKLKHQEEMRSKLAAEADEATKGPKRQRPNLEEDLVETMTFSDDEEVEEENGNAAPANPASPRKKMKNQTFGQKAKKKNKIKKQLEHDDSEGKSKENQRSAEKVVEETSREPQEKEEKQKKKKKKNKKNREYKKETHVENSV